MELTESLAILPAASIPGSYVSQPEARFSAVGLLGRDQVEEYATRKGIPLGEAERWLAGRCDPTFAKSPADQPLKAERRSCPAPPSPTGHSGVRQLQFAAGNWRCRTPYLVG
jgi:hypothetical protein